MFNKNINRNLWLVCLQQQKKNLLNIKKQKKNMVFHFKGVSVLLRFILRSLMSFSKKFECWVQNYDFKAFFTLLKMQFCMANLRDSEQSTKTCGRVFVCNLGVWLFWPLLRVLHAHIKVNDPSKLNPLSFKTMSLKQAAN